MPSARGLSSAAGAAAAGLAVASRNQSSDSSASSASDTPFSRSSSPLAGLAALGRANCGVFFACVAFGGQAGTPCTVVLRHRHVAVPVVATAVVAGDLLPCILCDSCKRIEMRCRALSSAFNACVGFFCLVLAEVGSRRSICPNFAATTPRPMVSRRLYSRQLARHLICLLAFKFRSFMVAGRRTSLQLCDTTRLPAGRKPRRTRLWSARSIL